MYKIYIVEDDKGIAEGIAGCLSSWEMEVRIVSDFRNVPGEINVSAKSAGPTLESTAAEQPGD